MQNEYYNMFLILSNECVLYKGTLALLLYVRKANSGQRRIEPHMMTNIILPRSFLKIFPASWTKVTYFEPKVHTIFLL